jgi:hypothetical protein
MRIADFHHVIRAAAGVTGETIFVVVGSQAILAQFPNAPVALLRSQELDIYPKLRPDLAELIEGSIGADSAFHGTFGYHADGVGPETAKLPRDWESRAIRVQAATTNMAIAICPEVNDLAVSKIIAGREKDIDWVKLLIGSRMASAETIASRLDSADADQRVIDLARSRLTSMRADDHAK